jgi:hypothetical protein
MMSAKPLPESVGNETVDAFGMNTSAIETQIAEGIVLKKKLDAKKKSGTRRGPVARKFPADSTARDGDPSSVAGASLDGNIDFLADDGFDAYQFENFDLPGFDDSQMSIADLKFYEDCVSSQSLEEDEYAPSQDSGVGQRLEDGADYEDNRYAGTLILQKGKVPGKERFPRFSTWGGINRDKYVYGRGVKHPRKALSSGDMLLRKSTDDFQCELEKMENMERENALRVAEEAWGQ